MNYYLARNASNPRIRVHNRGKNGSREQNMPSNLFDLSGQVAIVTGASRGLGQHMARVLASAGADLVITSRDRTRVAAFEKEVLALGRRVLSLDLDVRNLESIRRMAVAAENFFGRLDILVNNAGCNVRKPALDVTWDDWNLVVETNLRGSFFVAQEVARRMIPRRYGRIINIGSITSVMGYAGLGPYGASRGGIRQLTMSLADDWQGRYHRELSRPGLVLHGTEQSPLRKRRVGAISLRAHSRQAPRRTSRS